MADIKVILISSVRPEPTSGGQILLHRHLIGQAGIEVEIYGNEPNKLTPTTVVRRTLGRLGRTRLRNVSDDFRAMWGGRWLDGMLPGRAVQNGHTVVLTVAYGDACTAALRFAEKHRLPLVTFFHDWWPDIPCVHAPFRRRLEKNFRQLYQKSTVAFCVCEGMKIALGPHPCAPVLYPTPQGRSDNSANVPPPPSGTPPFRLFYFGNLFEYGPMVGDALRLFGEHKSIRLEVRGSNPNWLADFRESMRVRGLWKDFAPRNELDAWLADADAFLIPMAFDAELRRRMETSFPSKLIEFTQLGKPLVIWGPDYCSAVKWARQGNRALCVTDPSPASLRKSLEDLAASPAENQRLVAAAREAAQSDFNPDRIQAQFSDALRNAVKNMH